MVKKKKVAKKRKVVTKKKNKMSAGSAAALGAGVVAVSAGAYYFFLGPKGKQHRTKAKALMTEMETEVEKKLKKAKSVTLPLYRDAVDTIAATYSKRYKEHAPEIKELAKKLKKGWDKSRNKIRSS